MRWAPPVALNAADYAAIVLDPRGQFAAPSLSCHEFLARKRRFYQQLGPNDIVRRAIAAARNATAKRLVVGLHVRAYDGPRPKIYLSARR